MPAAPERQPGWPGNFLARWAAAVVVAVAAGTVVVGMAVAPPYDPHAVIRADGCGYHIWTYAILKGDPSFRWFEGDPVSQSLHRPHPEANRFTCKYPPGVALVRLPAMVWVVDASRNGPPYSLGENLMCQALGAAALVGVAVFGLLACRELGLPAWWSQFAVLILTFGTGLYHYGTFDAGFSHVYSALGVAWLVWQGAKAGRRGGRVAFAGAVGIAGVCGLLLLVRSTNVFLVAFWVATAGWRAWAAGQPLTGQWAAVAGAAAGVALSAGLNYCMFGRLTMNSYPGEGFVWDRPMMLSVLVSDNQGLVRYYPVLAAAVLVGLIARPTRSAAVWLLGLVFFYAAFYGYWWSWSLGVGFGHRGFVDLVPFAVPVLAGGLAHLSATRPWLARGCALACLGFAGRTVGLMFGYWGDQMPPA